MCGNRLGAPDVIDVLIITEIADPFNNDPDTIGGDPQDGNIRYVEIFNLSKEPVILSSGFFLRRITNGDGNIQVCSGLTVVNVCHPGEIEEPVGEIGVETDCQVDTLPRNAQSPVVLNNTIQPRSTYVVAADCGDFEAVFGFSPDECIGIDGPADSNGFVSETCFMQGKKKGRAPTHS